MREIRLRAEYIILKHKRELRRETLLMRMIIPGIFVCLGAGASAFFGNGVLLLPSAAGVCLLLYFYFAQRLFLTGRYIFLSGERGEVPLIRFSSVMRFALFRITAGTRKLLRLSFFLLPSRLILVIIYRTLYETGNIQRVMLLTLISAFIVLTAVGLFFSFYLSGRYYISDLLFIRCQRQKPSEIMKNSALLTTDSLREIMLFRIRNLFSRGGVTGKMRCAIFSRDLFSDRKFYKNYGL
ncbi:MAG: hypothetical protein J6A97_09765 [Clostridia bacterium]|nr:hypothetical protein [Clostridia bacterium]